MEPNDRQKDSLETCNPKETLYKTWIRPVILPERQMSEPFSIATGLLAIIGSAYRIAKETHDFIRDIKSAPKRIRSLSDDINIFCSILLNLERVLREDGRFSSAPMPKVPEALEAALVDSMRIFKDLARIISTYVTGSGDNSTPVWRAFVWTWNSKEVKSLTDEMKAQKETLSLALTEAI